MNSLRPLLVLAACCFILSGCRISDHKNGNSDNVEIGTPFGSMHVKTNTSDSAATDTGITPYPGAAAYKGKDSDTDSADVNMSFGSFHLGVRAATYKTQDNQDSVIAFYKKDLARYGDVIECRGNNVIGQPSRTSQGLTCDDESKHAGTHIHTINAELQLRTGSPDHQHIVAISGKDGGTKIGLVDITLPEHHSSSDSE
jgi:hypothetical protein